MTREEVLKVVKFLNDRDWIVISVGVHYDDYRQPIDYYVSAYDQYPICTKTWNTYKEFTEYFHEKV